MFPLPSRPFLAIAASVVLLAVSARSSAEDLQAIAIERPANEELVDFSRDLAPALRRSCVACHSSSKSRGDVNLENVEALLQGNDDGPIVVPGKSGESRLLRVAAHLDDPAMPPPKNKVGAEPLSSQELGRLAAWIDQGAIASKERETTQIHWNALPSALQPIYAVAVSANGHTVACGRARRIDLHDLVNGRWLASLEDERLASPESEGQSPGLRAAHLDEVQSLAFHPDGELLASGGYRVVKFWRRARGERRRTLALPEGARLLAASDDGSRFAVALADHSARVLGQDLEELLKVDVRLDEDGATESLVAAAIDTRSGRLALLTSRRLEVCSLTDGATLSSAPAPEAASGVAFEGDEARCVPAAGVDAASLRDGSLSASLVDGGIVRVTDRDGKTLAEIRAQDTRATRRAAMDRSIADRLGERVEDARRRREETEKARGEREKSLGQVVEAETKAKEAHDAKLAELEKLRSAEPPDQKAIEKAEKESQDAENALKNAMRNTADARADVARTVETLAGRDAELAQATARQEAASTTAQASDAVAVASRADVRALAFSETALWVATADGKAHRFSLPDLEPDETIECGVARSLRVAGDALVVEGEGELSVWSETTPYRLVATLGDPAHSEPFADRVLSLAFSPDGRALAVGGGEPSRSGVVSLFDGTPLDATPPEPPTLLWTNESSHSDVVTGLEFSPDGLHLATAGTDKIARLLDRETGAERRFFEGHTEHVLGVSWSRDARTLATVGADRTLRVWNVETGESRKTIQGFGKQATAVSFLGASGETVSASGDRRLRVHRADNGQELRSYGEIASYVYALAVLPDGRTVVAGGHDGVLHVWDAKDGKKLRALAPPSAE